MSNSQDLSIAANDNSAADFTCQDCHAEVFSFGRPWCPVPPQCEACRWLASIEDPVERERIRVILDGEIILNGQ